jgi:dTDP-4-dehydrorhamnose 3,5-epimerase-like enzyme
MLSNLSESLQKVEHQTIKDSRGSFSAIKLDSDNWDQCSIATNKYAFTFRGLHYQTDPPQKKYVKVIQGSIIDFSVDLNDQSVRWAHVDDQQAVEISEDRSHGYLTLEPNTIVAYLVKGEYNPKSEKSIIWSDNEEVKKLVKRFAGSNPITLSEKDKLGKK